MATTALFAELLVIGLQALAWMTLFVLALTGDRAGKLLPHLTPWVPLVTIVVVAVAYVLGVLLDRVADRVFQSLDKSEERMDGVKVSVARLTVASKSEGLARFLDYVRTRTRIARATALNLAIGTTAVVYYLIARDALTPSGVVLVITVGAAATLLTYRIAGSLSKTYYKRLREAYAIATASPAPPVPAQPRTHSPAISVAATVAAALIASAVWRRRS